MTQDATIHGSAYAGLCFFRNSVEMVRNVKLALKCFSISGSQSQLVVYGGLFDEVFFFPLDRLCIVEQIASVKVWSYVTWKVVRISMRNGNLECHVP